MKMVETTPVPIVVENHEGERLRMIRRHPWEFLDSIRASASDLVVLSSREGFGPVDEGAARIRCAAGIVIAGLSAMSYCV